MFDLGAEDINVILSVAPPSVHVCLDLFSISLLAGWGLDWTYPGLAPGLEFHFLRQCLAVVQKIRLNKLSLSFTLIVDIFGKKRLFQLMLMFFWKFFPAASDLLWLCSALTWQSVSEVCRALQDQSLLPPKPQIKQVKGDGAINK